MDSTLSDSQPAANWRLWRCRLWLLTLLAAWAGLASPALADRLQEIQDRGHVVIGVKEDYAPFGFRDADGALVGYDVDVARGFAEAIGVDAELVPVTSANRLQKVGRGEIDIVAATMGDTRSRRELVTMIEPQYYGDGANVLLRDSAKIGSWADLRGQTVCGLQGSLWNRLAKQRLLLDVTPFNSTREISQALRNEHCVGWIYDEVLLLDELETGEWEGFSVSLPTQFVLPWAVAIAKEEGGGRLDQLLGDTVAEWHRDGFLQSLEQKWGLPPSPFLRKARTIWREVDEYGVLKCLRNEQGRWPLRCLGSIHTEMASQVASDVRCGEKWVSFYGSKSATGYRRDLIVVQKSNIFLSGKRVVIHADTEQSFRISARTSSALIDCLFE